MAPADLPTDFIELRHGPLVCLISPEHGGSILRFALDRPGGMVDLMRPTPPGARSPLDMACFPLVPFSNRIAHGRFHVNGRTVSLPPNMDGCAHVIHGQGWLIPWDVEGVEAGWLRLSYRNPAGLWPWAYRAVQTFALNHDRLTVTLELFNEADEPFPAGLGLHPYFPKPPGTILTADVGGVWLTDADVLPTAHAALPEAWDFRRGLALAGVALDHGFTGWNGRATLDWPDDGLRLTLTTAGPLSHLVIYAPADGGFVCVEPVSHMTDAVNHPEAGPAARGLTTLEPGARLAAQAIFTVEPLGR